MPNQESLSAAEIAREMTTDEITALLAEVAKVRAEVERLKGLEQWPTLTAKLQLENERLKADERRLNWLETSGAWRWANFDIDNGIPVNGLGLRSVIDAAIQKENKTP